MGGVIKYEKTFFTPEYLLNHKKDEQLIEDLKNLLASQMPLLDIGVKLHSHRESVSLWEMQWRLEENFKTLKKIMAKK